MEQFDDNEEENLFEEAQAEEREARERSITDWFMMGVNAYIHEVYDEAVLYFDRVIEFDSKNARAYVNRGDVYAEMEAYEEAFDDYAMAVHLGSKEALSIAEEFIAEIFANRIITEQQRERFYSMLHKH
jgi:tetratricopeptide (TPR) repeat protein